jgi:hypothetical protein
MATPTSTPRRRWRTISLRGLMLLILLTAVWLGWETNRARRQKHAIETIQRAGGLFFFDDESTADGTNGTPSELRRPAWQKWLMRTVGDDYVRRAYCLDFEFSSTGRRSKLGPGVVRALADLHDLALLRLDGTDITDADLAAIGSLHRLTYLNLSDNRKISDLGLAHLKGLRKLEGIELARTSVGDEGINHLKGLPHLADLRLNGLNVGDRTLALVPNWPELRVLELRGSRITDKGMAHLRGLKQLWELAVDDTLISDAGLANIADLRTLKILYLTGTPTGDAGLARLDRLEQLRFLAVGSRVTDGSLPTLKRMTNLKELHLDGSNMSQEGFIELMNTLPTTKTTF